jgi:hypothetical protein
MLTVILALGHIPLAWKSKAISFVYKKGSPHNHANYMPLSVIIVIYRIFTVILASR